MHKFELERLLEKAVADALGVALPDEPGRRPRAVKMRHAPLRRTRNPTLARRHHRVAEHA